MTDKEFTLATLYDDFFKIAKVNLFTGDYVFVKAVDEEADADFFGTHTIDEYTQAIVGHGLIFEDDIKDYLHHISLNYLQDKIIHRQRRLVHSFRRKWGTTYIWLTIEVTVPKTFSESQPWVIFSWKEADSETSAMEDSIRMLSSIFHKILKINLTEDTHEDIKVYSSELEPASGFANRISDWLRRFAELGNVYHADLEDYYSFTDIEHLKSQFHQHNDLLRFRYRRKTDGRFRWVSMELLPSIEYTDENQVIMLYIRDIHDDYISQLQHQKELEYYCNYDNLTGIQNRYSYNQFCNLYNTGSTDSPIGVIFADVNGLKYINDHSGHAQGDAYIKAAAKLLVDHFGKSACYRISGDEFVVLLEQLPQDIFWQSFENFYNYLHQQESPIISVGAAWTSELTTISQLVREAEAGMYHDKQEFYKNHPKYKR